MAGNATISLNDLLNNLLWLTGFIASCWGVVKIIKEIKKPNEDLRIQVKENTQKIEKDYERIESMEETNKVLCECILALLNHEITGNSIDKMKESRDKMEKHLIQKS